MAKQKILIVDDDNNIAELISLYLMKECFDTMIVEDGEKALEQFGQFQPNLILLDLMLPGIDGYQVCREIRRTSNVPIIMLSAKGEVFDKVLGLELGADDYISKPFRPRELISRMNSVLRRCHRGSQPLEYHELKADTVRGLVYKNNVELTLSALEYRLLLLFLSNQGIVLTRSRLLDELWDMAGEFVNDNTLTVYIKRLREKIEADPAHPEYIKTIRGLGYKLGD